MAEGMPLTSTGQAKSSILEQDASAPSGNHHIPTFTDKYEERQWAKGHMAAAFRTFARLGYADGASGHISLRDPVNPEHFWISKYNDSYSKNPANRLQTRMPCTLPSSKQVISFL
jgi:hypothetical protein